MYTAHTELKEKKKTHTENKQKPPITQIYQYFSDFTSLSLHSQYYTICILNFVLKQDLCTYIHLCRQLHL